MKYFNAKRTNDSNDSLLKKVYNEKGIDITDSVMINADLNRKNFWSSTKILNTVETVTLVFENGDIYTFKRPKKPKTLKLSKGYKLS